MSKDLKLFMILLGCKPEDRNTEQHDIYFGIANSLIELVPSMHSFWPEAKEELHIDAWREVTSVGDFQIKVIERNDLQVETKQEEKLRLFFINLGGYKQNEFDEFHYKMLIVAENIERAKEQAKAHTFFLHTGFKGATSHIDDKYGVDIDDMFAIEDILGDAFKKKYKLMIASTSQKTADKLHLGYLPLSTIK